MIEIQCTSCQTRYRIDERILPEDTPTFKCSRCGHVFSAEPRPKVSRRAGAESARGAAMAKAAASASPDPTGADADAPASLSAPVGSEAVQPPSPPELRAAAPAAPEAPAAPAPTRRPRQAGAAGRRVAAEPSRAATTTGDETRPPIENPEPPREDPGQDFHALGSQQDAPQDPQQDPRYDTRELLQRRFAEIIGDKTDKPGKNLAFDFNDEPRSPDAAPDRYPEERWEVGDADLPTMPPTMPPPRRPKRHIRISDIDDDLDNDALDRSFGRNQAGDRVMDRDDDDFGRIRPDEVSAEAHRLEADLRGRAYKLHSAGYFIGLFALVVFAFGIVTMVIQSAPIASAGLLSALPIVGAGLEPPVSPAQRVALGGVEGRYVNLKGNQPALVISGTAENLTSKPLGAVQIEAALTASGAEPLRSQSVYCGNNLTLKMLGEMTPREIEFFERLDAPKSFALEPQASAPFVIVFIAPPAGASHFQLRIVRADPAAAAPMASTEGG
ncbi:MAG TPA: DUF3426 domain-containing protein [Candidatus Binataceae bacterium]|nr:DUF3426 domain-containing protein [Candidatus Binataceae bacterium]